MRYREAAERAKETAKRVAKDARVYVFGSVLAGRYTAASDIDIPIVADIGRDATERLKAEIYRSVNAPVEVHVANHTIGKSYVAYMFYKRGYAVNIAYLVNEHEKHDGFAVEIYKPDERR